MHFVQYYEIRLLLCYHTDAADSIYFSMFRRRLYSILQLLQNRELINLFFIPTEKASANNLRKTVN